MRESSVKTPERRQAPRTKLVEIAYIGMGPENGGLVLDVSDGGLSFQAVAPVKPAETVNFLLSLRGHSRIEGAGKVVWTNEMRTVCGLRFTSLSSGAREHLNNWTNQSRMPAPGRVNPRVNPVSPPPPAPPPAPSQKVRPPASFTSRPVASAEPVFAIPPAAGLYLSEPAGRTLWSGQLFLWIVFGVLSATVMVSAYLYGLHVGRSESISMTQSAPNPSPQTDSLAPEPVAAPAASPAMGEPSAPVEGHGVPNDATSAPMGAPTASTVATTIPGAGTNAPSAALVNAVKTDETPVNTLQRPGDEGRGTVASEQHAEQALQAGKSELAAALASLHGTNGVRDSAKAARLLWAAVANDNSTAEVTLADLYIHGDGVPKSCEQGRVLLLAASKSGDAQASEKLGELYRNGCP